MQTRRDFIKTVPIAAGAFTIGGSFMLESAAGADETAILTAEPHKGHFHPQGKAPSVHTVRMLEQARASLPFSDESDLAEWARGFIAPMPDLQIMADAGNVALDMAKFKFLDQEEPFDSIHPSLHRIGRLNNNYGLYEVAPGSIRPGASTLRTSPSCAAAPAGSSSIRSRRPSPLRLVGAPAGACGRGSARLRGDLFTHPYRPLGRRARPSARS